MKFGKKLDRLSIPEWKPYNIDYNELKHQIKLITTQQSENASISSKDSIITALDLENPSNDEQDDELPLSLKQFTSNFKHQLEYVNLFTVSKKKELQRKIDLIQNHFTLLVNSNQLSEKTILQIHNNLVITSKSVKNLSKFIVIQKIALRKLFKKFKKHYLGPGGTAFIETINDYLSSEKDSFINLDLTPLILEITFFFELLKDPNLLDTTTPTVQQLGSTTNKGLLNNTNFDINSIIKTSFQINYLTNAQNSNELKINLSIYFKIINDDIQSLKTSSLLQLRRTGSLTNVQLSNDLNDVSTTSISTINQETTFSQLEKNSYCSILFLANFQYLSPPSIVFTEYNKNESIIISEVGGLRKHSYCRLSNDLITTFLTMITKRSKQNSSNADIKEINTLEEQINAFINDFSGLTKMTLSWINNKRFVPCFKKTFKRFRYYFDGELDTDVLDDENVKQNYYISFDTNIHTTIEDLGISFDKLFNEESLSSFKKFPYDNLSIGYNNKILSVPNKIKNIIDLNRVNLNYYENLNWFYFLSSYYSNLNFDSFNTLKNLKSLSLLKSNETLYENVDKLGANVKQNQHNNSANQRSTLNNTKKPGYGSVSDASLNPTTNKSSSSKNSKDSSKEFTLSSTVGYWNEFDHDYDNLYNTNNRSEDYYYDANPYDIEEHNFMNSLLNIVQSFKEKFIMRTKSARSNQHSNRVRKKKIKMVSEEEHFKRYQETYDKVLSFLYLTFSFVSMILIGMLLGITYSILNMNPENIVTDNFFLIFSVFLLLIITLIINMLSIYFMFLRFQFAPIWHYVIVCTGFTIVCVAVVWCILKIIIP